MNKLSALVLTAALLSGTSAYSQTFIGKGSITANTLFLFNTGTDTYKQNGTTSSYKTFSFDMNPSGGYFIIDDLGIGGGVSLGMISEKSKDTDYKTSGFSISFGPTVRYYFYKGLFVRGDFNIGWQTNKTELDDTTTETKYSIKGWEAGIGYSLRISETVFFDIVPVYEYTTRKNKDSDLTITQKDFSLRAGFMILLVSR